MKKIVLTILLGNSALTIASEAIDYSCEVEKGHKTFLTSTKGNKNVIHVDIKLDSQSCKISREQDIMNIYWKLGEKERAGVRPCQGLSKWEKRFFTLDENDIERLSDNKAIVRYPDLSSYGNKFGQNLSSEITVETYKDAKGKCQTRATITANSKKLVVDRVHTNIKGLSLRSVTFFKNGEQTLLLK